MHAPNESVDLAELERMVLAEALFIAAMADGLRAAAGEDLVGAWQGGERRG